MAGTIRLQEGTIQTITSTGASATSGSAVLAGTFDTRGTAPAATADMFAALFSLTAQWATVTGIAANTTVAELYLVPAIDGTNFPDVDLTAGASNIAYPQRVGSFVASKTPTANANMLFQSQVVSIDVPALYNVYILNRSGQTMSANWIVKALAAAAQYT